MSRHTPVFLVSCLLAACATAPAPKTTAPTKDSASLYDRVAQRLAGRGDLADLGHATDEVKALNWMIGTWQIEAMVLAGSEAEKRVDRGTSVIAGVMDGTWLQFTDAYPNGTQDIGFLTYNRVTRQWLSLGIDSNGNALVSQATRWEGDRLVFLAEHVQVLGETVTLRQTFTRRSHDEFELFNEEHLADGRWIALDRYTYRRSPAGTPTR